MEKELAFEIILNILIKAKIKEHDWEYIKSLIDTRYNFENLNSTIKEVY